MENLPEAAGDRADNDDGAIQAEACDLGGIKPPSQPHDCVEDVDLVIGRRGGRVLGQYLTNEPALFRVIEFDNDRRSLSNEAAEASPSGLALPLHLSTLDRLDGLPPAEDRSDEGVFALGAYQASACRVYPPAPFRNGLGDGAQRAAMADVLAHPAGRAEPTTTGYGQAYNVAALFEAGHPAAALALVRRYWGSMLERGATTFWESFDPDEPRATELDL